MTEATIGHNGQLKSLTERINAIEDEKKARADDIRDIYAEAKANGFDPKALRVIVRRQRADAKKLAEHEAVVELYMQNLGMI